MHYSFYCPTTKSCLQLILNWLFVLGLACNVSLKRLEPKGRFTISTCTLAHLLHLQTHTLSATLHISATHTHQQSKVAWVEPSMQSFCTHHRQYCTCALTEMPSMIDQLFLSLLEIDAYPPAGPHVSWHRLVKAGTSYTMITPPKRATART